jgi:hypothetical protein
MNRIIISLAVLLGLVVVVSPSFAQGSKAVDPQNKDRKIKPEPDRAFIDWLREVEPILSESEIDAWKKLTTNEEREKFIETVWRLRNPDPDTEENEYREAY